MGHRITSIPAAENGARVAPARGAYRSATNAADHRRLKIQLWSYNFDPEPTGIGIVSTVCAHGLRDLGHEVEVVAAHPDYPEPLWGKRILPYREVRNGISVLRLPLWIGRASTAARYRQELTFMAAQSAATPFLSNPDVLISASPSFPALLPAVMNVRARKVPWLLWLHDLLPDGATATGLVDEESMVLKLSRKLERSAYRAANRIVVLSRAFTDNLVAKGVPEEKIDLIYDPATRTPTELARPRVRGSALRILAMGNIGYSQGLTSLVTALEARPDLDFKLVITGAGVAADEARAEIKSDRIEMVGMISDEDLERELASADMALVSQSYQGAEFNMPSKLMNFMTYGLPVLAAVNPDGEVARLVRDSRAGWVVDASHPERLPEELRRLSGSGAGQVSARAKASRRYAERHFTQAGFTARFEQTLFSVTRNRVPVTG